MKTLDYVIFSIDQQKNPLKVAAFLSGIEDKLRGGYGFINALIGCYQGQTELCFIMYKSDFDAYVRGTRAIDHQESILIVAGDSRAHCDLEHLPSGVRIPVGPLRCVPEALARDQTDWVHNPQTGLWYVASQSVPISRDRRKPFWKRFAESFKPKPTGVYAHG